ncbi:MAG: hypothetical protein COB09_10630 [Thalassobium sp.]|nr:MAG: hypothetical protein COB09_10630 [Thalassobium sp.]
MRVTTTQLVQWSDTRDAQGMLPLVVRRLISSTARVTALVMPGGDSVNVSGWDGVVESVEGNAWVPDGVSYWELGTSKDPGSKAGSDFEKRLNQISKVDAAKATFVFVTPRRWPRKNTWLESARKRNVWANVLAWDADDLEAWLETSFPTTLWFGMNLGIAGHGVDTVESYWKHWSDQSSPQTTAKALLCGREESKTALKNSIQREQPLIPVMADSQSEAVAFVCALLIDEGYSQRSACITSQEGWQFVDANSGIELVVITDNRLSDHRAPRDKMSLIVPMAFGDQEFNLGGIGGKAAEEGAIELRRPKPEEFEKALLELGIAKSDASRYTRTLGRSWTVLRRWLAQKPSIKKPIWTDAAYTSSLLILTLVGAWNSASEGDKACIAEIANRPYEDIENELLDLLAIDDAPVVKIGSLWKAKAPLELLHLVAPKLRGSILIRFFDVANAVFAEPDPVLELEEDKRWMAAIHGKVREQTSVVLKAMAESITKLGYFSENRGNLELNNYVRRFVTNLLESASEERWLSVSSFLRSFAEAAPDEFLRAIERSLRDANKPVTRLIRETQHAGTFARCWHAELLWSLELLAWHPTRLSRVSNILTELSKEEIKGNWGNTPFNSLLSLFRSWYPQTAAPVELRLLAIEKVITLAPEVGWNLLMALLPAGHSMASPNMKPQWRDDDSGAGDVVTDEEIRQLILPVADLLLEQAQRNAKRIAELVPKIDSVDENFREGILSLVSKAKELQDEDREIVRSAVREFLSWENSYNQSGDKHDRFSADKLRPLFDDLAPGDLVLRHTWIFSNGWIELPDGREEDCEVADKARALLRERAIKEIYENLGWTGIERLAKRCGEPRLIGLKLINKPFERDDLIPWLCQWYLNLRNNSVFDSLTQGVLHALPQEEITKFLKTCLHFLEKQTKLPEKIAGVMVNAPQSMDLWKLVERFSPAVGENFWEVTTPRYFQGTSEHLSFCITKLLDSQRPKTALSALGDRAEELSSKTLIRILRQILSGEEGHIDFPKPWHISRLFKALSKSKSHPSELVSLEFAYYPALKNDKYGTPHLIEELLKNPDSFMELICLVFKPQHSEREPLPENLHTAAETAGAVIMDGRGVPGKISSEKIDRELFSSWINRVRELAKEKDREATTDLTIGAWFSDWPIGKDLQSWPVPVIAELLDKDEHEDIRRGFHTGVHNARGVTSRMPYDGGAQERAVADEFRRFSSHWQNTKPNLSALIEKLAKSFEYDAQRHDEDGLWSQEH